MALPLRLLWGLQVNRKQKTALVGIFSLAFIIIIFAIVRVIKTSASDEHVDPIWLALWSMMEGSVGEKTRFITGHMMWIFHAHTHSGGGGMPSVLPRPAHRPIVICSDPPQTDVFWLPTARVQFSLESCRFRRRTITTRRSRISANPQWAQTLTIGWQQQPHATELRERTINVPRSQ